jgi:hypothetical protein
VQVLRKIARSLSLLLLLLAAWLPAAASELACPSMDVYLRDGCPHCADAKAYLQQLQQRHPDLSIRYHEVGPSFLICEAFYAGFAMAAGSDEWIENQLLDPDANRQPYQVRTPLGEFSVDDIGLPAFTLALGLIDGFNPCAMWILLFLLSILVNIRSRRRIILIAGTFVVVSGMVYFAFMAAWLNLFLLIGFTRWLQIVIGVLALLIGAVHIKDFVAFGQGVSLSISDSVKPTLYARVRNIMHARSIWAALIAVTIVAIMVNMIELLCTAGLPAIYTQLLSLRPMTTAQYYGYLVLYNLAYIFDDALMVTITVFTMNRLKLQEKQGRWLKLISGLVIFTLGLILLTAPGMLL